MEENEILSIGFKKNQWEEENETFTEYIIGNGKVGIEISGTTLVEITTCKGVFITVPNCETIEDLKELVRLLNIN
jgi:hypothetical protein